MAVWQTIEGFCRALLKELEAPQFDIPRVRRIVGDLLDVAQRERETRTLRKYSATDLPEALSHLAFDVAHFRTYRNLIGNRELHTLCPAAGQAVLYSCLLHLRLLLDFFYGTPKEDDCCLGHFIELAPDFKAKFPPITSPTPEEARSLSKDLHKRLAHLTATRWVIKPAPNYRRYEKHYQSIDDLIQGFTDALPPELKAVFLRELKHKGDGHPPTVHLEYAADLLRVREELAKIRGAAG